MHEMNFELFINRYEIELRKAIKEYPKEYLYDESEVPSIVGRMKQAFIKKTYNKDGRAIKATCKILGIPYTYKGINYFLGTIGE